LNIARKLKRQHGFGYGYVPIRLLLRVVLKLVWAGESAIAFCKVVKLVKLLEFAKLNPRTMEVIYNDLKKKPQFQFN
jgi:hypothetical protein